MNEEVRPRWLSVINFLLIKVAWVACVVGGTLSGALVIALMFALVLSGRWQRERGFVVGLALLGLTLIMDHLGILDFGSGTLQLGNLVASLWIILLWVAVGLSLFEALGFFVRRPVLGAVIVGAAAPLSYSTVHNLAQ